VVDSRKYNWEFLRRNNDYQNDFNELSSLLGELIKSEFRDAIEDRHGVIDIGNEKEFRDIDGFQQARAAMDSYCFKWHISAPARPSQEKLSEKVDFLDRQLCLIQRHSVQSLSFSASREAVQKVGRDISLSGRFSADQSFAVVTIDLRLLNKKTAFDLIKQLNRHKLALRKPRKVESNTNRLDRVLKLCSLGISSVESLLNSSIKSEALLLFVDETKHVRIKTKTSFEKQLKQDAESIADLLSRAPLIPFK
jgi:hypothetical protein